jgi:hypothetical protein
MPSPILSAMIDDRMMSFCHGGKFKNGRFQMIANRIRGGAVEIVGINGDLFWDGMNWSYCRSVAE